LTKKILSLLWREFFKNRREKLNYYSKTTIESYKAIKPKFVNIDEARLIAHAEKYATHDFILPRWDTKGVHPQNNLAFPSHCFWHNVVNFCYGHPRRMKNGRILKFRTRDVYGITRSGSYAMGACFYREFGERPILAEDMLPHVESLSKVKKFFRGAVSIPLISERWELLTEAVCRLEEYFKGDPKNILEEGRYKAFGVRRDEPGIVDVLIKFFPETFGSDKFVLECGGHKPLEFNLYKRAQLFVLEYHGRAAQSSGELKPISDIEEIGPIADYELPKALRAEGIFRYSEELEAAIKNLKPIIPNSLPEIELRAGLIFAIHRWLLFVNSFRKELSLAPIHIGHADHFWWELGRKTKENHHLCFTTNY
jgi:hypothetical protein